jgi:hypothetical protein
VTPRLGVLALILAPLALVACEHTAPGAVQPPVDVGPYTATLPRRLTFAVLDDRTPSVSGGVLVYARQGDAYANTGYAPTGREECLAFLPVEGGTIERLLCPHSLLSPADTFVHTWYEPALSPDGTRIAFTWQRGPNVGPLGFWDTYLMVTPVDRPTDTTRIRAIVNYAEAGLFPRRADFASKLAWLDDGHLRFLATWEHIFKVKSGSAARVTDTAYVPLALEDMDLATQAIAPVPGGDSAIAWGPAPSGGVWLVREPQPDALVLLDPVTHLRTPVGHFLGAVTDLAVVDGAAVAITSAGAALERLDPATGAVTVLGTSFAGPMVHIAAAGGRRFVVQAQQATQPFGAPSDLWLLEVPGP